MYLTIAFHINLNTGGLTLPCNVVLIEGNESGDKKFQITIGSNSHVYVDTTYGYDDLGTVSTVFTGGWAEMLFAYNDMFGVDRNGWLWVIRSNADVYNQRLTTNSRAGFTANHNDLTYKVTIGGDSGRSITGFTGVLNMFSLSEGFNPGSAGYDCQATPDCDVSINPTFCLRKIFYL